MSATETRSAARSALVVTVALILAFVMITADHGGSSTAQAQASPTLSGYTIEWVNPDDSGGNSEVSAQQKTGQGAGSANYHLVAWVNRMPPDAFVEFCRDDCNPTSERITPETEGAQHVDPDTWEHFWSPLPADGSYTLTARFFSGGTLLDSDSVTVTVNNVVEPAPPNSLSEGVEIVDPVNGDALGFYRPPNGDAYSGVIDVAATSGATVIEAKYSVSGPGTEPNWTNCGYETKDDAEDDGLRCELAEADSPEDVTAVAAIAYDDPSEATAEQPAQVQNQFREGGDAHRIDSYTQVPETLNLEFVNDNGTVAGDSVSVNPGSCSPALRSTVTDQNDEPVPDVNVDLHASGPDDDIRFVDVDAAGAPDQGGHTTSDPAKDCAGADSGTQGEHDSPAGDDTKHVESTDNTNDDGTFSVKLWHANSGAIPGDTQISAWADLDGNDTFCSKEPNDNAAIGWGATASATGTGSETDACTLPGSSPSPTFTPTPSGSASPSGSSTPTTTSTTTTTSGGTGEQRVATNLTINYRRGVFTGSAGSSKRKCQTGRLVTLKKQRRGRDRTVGKDRTNRSGNWKVRPRRVRRGRYYAVVATKRYTQPNGVVVVCRSDKSPTIRAGR